MDILKQFLLILLLCLCGDIIAQLLPFAFPASVISLLLFFFLLLSGIIKPQQIARVADFLLHSMAFFFVPAGVAIIEKYHLIQKALIPLFIITLLTTVFTFVVTSYTVLCFIKLMNKKETM